MAWQKTFTLSKRSKGCYLVTDEVMSHIESGLNAVQVRTYATSFYDRAVANGRLVDWNAVLIHVCSCHKKYWKLHLVEPVL